MSYSNFLISYVQRSTRVSAAGDITKMPLTPGQPAPILTITDPDGRERIRSLELCVFPQSVDSGNLIPRIPYRVLPTLHYANAKQAFPSPLPILIMKTLHRSTSVWFSCSKWERSPIHDQNWSLFRRSHSASSAFVCPW